MDTNTIIIISTNITIAIGIVAIIFNQSKKIDDVKTELTKKIDDVKDELTNLKIEVTKLNSKFDRLYFPLS